MKINRILLLLPFLAAARLLSAQVSTNCTDGLVTGNTTYSGTVFFNYGSVANSFSTKNRTTASVGEIFVGSTYNQSYFTNTGFYSRFLLPPSPPVVTATEGDLKDRIQVNWVVDPLSPSAEGGFNIYRDGAFIDHVEKEIRVYIDFNVQAGQFYTYTVKGVNSFGEGYAGTSLGFLNPNGVVTGQVKTFNGNPVADAEITLTPTLGTSLAFSGDDVAFAEYNAGFISPKWTMVCWVKVGAGNDQGSIIDFGSNLNKNWWLQTLPGGSKGVRFHVGTGSGSQPVSYPFTGNPDGWHHVAAVYTGATLLLYVDGQLAGTVAATISTATDVPLFFGRKPGAMTNYYTGGLDDVRLFNRQLSQTEINQYKNRTVNADADGLAAYWKFDEGIGVKGYDISENRFKTYLCGAQWSNDRPDVVNGAVTDASGFYKIEGINYGGGQTFTATPSKVAYDNYALEFNAANQHYATLTDSVLLGVTQAAAVEVRLQSFENVSATRTVLANQTSNAGTNLFQLNLASGNINVQLGTINKSYGALGTGYQHLVVNLKKNGSSTDVSVYKNGTLVSTQNFAAAFPNLGPQTWSLGAVRTGAATFGQYFSGLVDEVAFYDTTMTLADIQTHNTTGVAATHPRLRSWFPFNESQGTTPEDIGPARTGFGAIQGPLWSRMTAITASTAHEFQPDKRLLTLNPSNTSSDQIDFTDLSTVAVSGYVRYDGTDCFADSVEILGDGQPFTPPVMTDLDGRFVVDLEPGTTVRLSARFKNHAFSPPSWEVRNVVAPVAGILFRDMTKRQVRGQMAGNDSCRLSIIPANGLVQTKVKVETLDGCYYREMQIPAVDGHFVFNNLPPVPVTVAVTNHPDAGSGGILQYFQNQGGKTSDLTEKNDTVDFIYYAPPGIEITPLPLNECGDAMLEQSGKYTVDIKVYQQYEGGRCYLDSAGLHIENGFSDAAPLDTVMSGGKFRYVFPGGMPNIVPPYLKTMTVQATANNRTDSEAVQAVVTGKRPRNVNFASTTPEIPVMILRDPPGDASNASIEQGKTVCNGWSLATAASATASEELEVSIGFDTEIATGIGVEKTFQVDVTNTSTFGMSATVSSSVSTSMETCITATQVISTSDGDGIIGSDADVYVGGALNLLFGITDDLRLDTTGANCAFFRDTGVVVFPEKFQTNFFYTEHHIVNTLIPNLLTVGDTESAAAWQHIIDVNHDLKAQAAFEQNISFDAGVVYESSTSYETTKALTYGFGVEVTASTAEALGLEVDGVGLGKTISFELTMGVETEFSSAETNSTTVGYTLADDDIGDNFTVNVLRDKVYGTPVFKTVSGNTSCPYEPTTVPRDGVNLAVDKTIATNVLANDPAIFRFTVGNISETDEERSYVLALNPASNPDGAIVNIQGQGTSVPFTVEPFGNQEVIVTVERGPSAFVYENLELVLYAECEGADSDDPNFSKTIELDVQFLEPCSPVDIGSPFQDWVLTPASGNTMFITLNEFDRNDPDLELIRVQYRRSQGDGAWINIAEVPKAGLDNDVFKIVQWNTAGLKDGLYEIRAITQCLGGQNPGISRIIKGKIEREPPEIFGTPEPADGVLSPGDEISITFTEPIRCDQIIQATQFPTVINNNLGLYNAETGELIDATITCSGDKIIIVPNIQNTFIEGKVLRVEVDNLKDLVGNTFVHAEWEFFVDRGPLDLEGGNVDVTMYEGEEKVELRQLINRGGSIAAFQVSDVPNWLTVFPNVGTLQPGEEVTITYRFAKTLPQGLYNDTIYFRNAQGDERVIVNARVLCAPPAWDMDPALYPTSMNFTVKLDIEGDVSEDEEDIVAAFIDGELRGSAHVQFVAALDQYIAFLTVYGDTDDEDQPVNLQIWDASACLRYGEVIEQYDFNADNVAGVLNAPVILHTNSQVLREIPIRTGWNWLSFNLAFPNPAVTPALASLQHPENDIIKSQVDSDNNGIFEGVFALYSGSNWMGSLSTLNNRHMFQYRADVADTLRMLGGLIDPATIEIPVNAGWNWIGYVPNYALPVSEALGSLTPLNGDIIKGQSAFAQYLAGHGWLGSLQFMEAPQGYQLKIGNPGTLLYPPSTNKHQSQSAGGGIGVPPAVVPPLAHWQVDPSQFEHSMTLVGMFSDAGLNATLGTHELGAFAGNELRGAGPAIYVEPLNVHLFFLTAYANTAGEQVRFRLFNSVTGQEADLQEKMWFSPDLHQGSIEQPVPFTLQSSSTATPDAALFLDVQPNPFGEQTLVLFGQGRADTEADLLICDALGRLMVHEKVEARPGLNTRLWNTASVPAGVYTVRLQSGEAVVVKKVVRE